MLRAGRIALGGTVYHVLNRANGRLRIFRKAADFPAFETILADGIGRFSMRLCGYCLMGFPVQGDRHYLTVRRYIEANPLRPGLVSEAGQWPWSSYAIRGGRESPVPLERGPVELPSNWGSLVHRDISQPDQDRLANSLRRGAPFGGPRWVQTTAARLNLESTLRPRGRPETCTEHVQLTGFDAPIHGPSKPVGSSGKR